MNSIPVVYENDEILIINKPCGLAVQGGEGIVHSVDRLLPVQTGAPVFLVHRLDKETAGLLVVAKTPAAARKWISELQKGSVKKEYAAVCVGKPAAAKGRLSDSISHKGKEQAAETFFKLEKTSSVTLETGDVLTFSLLNLTLGTGRMHQIRIHLAQNGFPIIADDKYGNFRMNKTVQKAFHIKKLALAAVRLTIPVDGKPRTFQVELPPHMQQACQVLSLSTLD